MKLSRREVLKAATAAPVLQAAIVSCANAEGAPPTTYAGVDRVTILPGKTYLRGWVGYGEAPMLGRPQRYGPPPATPPAPPPTGPAAQGVWSKVSGPGEVKFEDANALITTAAFTKPGDYVLKLTGDNGEAKSESRLNVSVEMPPPAK